MPGNSYVNRIALSFSSVSSEGAADFTFHPASAPMIDYARRQECLQICGSDWVHNSELPEQVSALSNSHVVQGKDDMGSVEDREWDIRESGRDRFWPVRGMQK